MQQEGELGLPPTCTACALYPVYIRFGSARKTCVHGTLLSSERHLATCEGLLCGKQCRELSLRASNGLSRTESKLYLVVADSLPFAPGLRLSQGTLQSRTPQRERDSGSNSHLHTQKAPGKESSRQRAAAQLWPDPRAAKQKSFQTLPGGLSGRFLSKPAMD